MNLKVSAFEETLTVVIVLSEIPLSVVCGEIIMSDISDCEVLLALLAPTDPNPTGWTSSEEIGKKINKTPLEVETKCRFMVQDGLLKAIHPSPGLYEITSSGDRKRDECKKKS